MNAHEKFPISKLETALQYAVERNWAVLPLWWITPDGRCACGKPTGGHHKPGKHPIGKLVPNGHKNATKDPEQIRRWWSIFPEAAIGIATGSVSGLIVIDIDGVDGLATLQSLVCQHGPLARTAIVKTARGWHLYFAIPASCGSIPCSTGNGLDVRGDGGYAVAPPSRHASGHVYQWCEHVG
jgi:Bifunctional DNA primase/polymerase, N-terminal